MIVVEIVAGTCLYAAVQSLLCKYAKSSSVSGIIYGIAGTFQSIGLAVGPVFSAFVYEYKKQYLFKGLFLIASIVLFFYLYTIKKVGTE